MAQRLHAASTLAALTGDNGPQLAAIEHGLRQHWPPHCRRLQARTPQLVTTTGTDCWAQQPAVDALREIGLASLPPAAVNRLRCLAGKDERIIRSGFPTDTIRNDENLRAAIRQLLDQQD